jgi:hypothetical protein
VSTDERPGCAPPCCFRQLRAWRCFKGNALMYSVGKTPDSLVVLDLMRLPLGILSGAGVIGAVAILRRDNLVIGVPPQRPCGSSRSWAKLRRRTAGPGTGGLRTGDAGAVGYETDRRFIFAAAACQPDPDDNRRRIQRKQFAVHVGAGRGKSVLGRLLI